MPIDVEKGREREGSTPEACVTSPGHSEEASQARNGQGIGASSHLGSCLGSWELIHKA